MVKSAALSLFSLLFFYGCAEWDLGLGTKDDGLPPPPPVQETAYPFTDIPIPSDFSRMIPSPLFMNRVQEQLK